MVLVDIFVFGLVYQVLSGSEWAFSCAGLVFNTQGGGAVYGHLSCGRTVSTPSLAEGQESINSLLWAAALGVLIMGLVAPGLFSEVFKEKLK